MLFSGGVFISDQDLAVLIQECLNVLMFPEKRQQSAKFMLDSFQTLFSERESEKCRLKLIHTSAKTRDLRGLVVSLFGLQKKKKTQSGQAHNIPVSQRPSGYDAP